MTVTHQSDTPIVWVDNVPYSITSQTESLLNQGIVPAELKEQISSLQGDDACFDFCRQRRLMKRALDQIRTGILPVSLTDLIASGSVPSEILFKLVQQKLIGKAEKLYQKKLLSDDTLKVIRTQLLTSEILPELKRAFLSDTAYYLYEKGEISKEILNGFNDGTIEPKYLLVIRRSYRKLCYLSEVESEHSYHEQPDEKGHLFRLESISDSRTEPDSMLFSEQNREYLMEALRWLSAEDYKLIYYIFFERISMRKIARMEGVSEGTIRYKKNVILGRLRTIFEEVMGLPYDAIF